MYGGSCPQFGERYGVVAAEHYGDDPRTVYRLESLLYPLVALLDIARDDGHVAVVYDREVVEDSHAQRGL